MLDGVPGSKIIPVITNTSLSKAFNGSVIVVWVNVSAAVSTTFADTKKSADVRFSPEAMRLATIRQ